MIAKAKSKPPRKPKSSARTQPQRPRPTARHRTSPSRRRSTHGDASEWLSILEALNTFLSTHTPPEPAFANESSLSLASSSPRTPDRAGGDESRDRQQVAPLIGRAALAALDTAYTATLHHYLSLLDRPLPLSSTEQQLARLWQTAGSTLRSWDPALAKRLHSRHTFWSAPAMWSRDTIRKAWPLLNSIRAHANRTDPEVAASLRWGRALAT